MKSRYLMFAFLTICLVKFSNAQEDDNGMQYTPPDSLSIVSEDLKEVTIQVGYGTKKQGTITGSVVQLKADEIVKNPAQSPMQAIQGKVAGLNITATDFPGGQPNVLLRGLSTINGNSNPLYIIDGVESPGLNGLSMNDIESINVLKDASSLAIYGNKAAYGVILITTKKGKGKLKVNYNGYMGAKTVLNRVRMSDAYRFTYFNNIAIGNPSFFNMTNLPYNTDWFKEITRVGSISEHAVNVSGSNEFANYLLGASHFTESGILKGSEFSRTNVISRNEFNLFEKRLKITQFANLSLISAAPKPNSAFTNAYLQAPIVPVRYPNGQFGQPFVNPSTGIVDYDGIRFNTVANPVAQLYFYNEHNRNTILTASFQADLKILDYLDFTSRYGATAEWSRGYTFTPSRDLWLVNNPTQTINDYNPNDPINILNKRRFHSYIWNWDNFFTFKKTFGEIHSINAVLGMSKSVARNGEFLSATRRNVPEQSNYWYLDFSNDNTLFPPGSVVSNSASTPLVALSYFARAEYILKDKYLLNASIRRDGMSDFQEDDRWGVFPGISAGWIISREDFFNVKWIDNLKVRAGYGEIGNANNLILNTISFDPGFTYVFGTNETINPGNNIPRIVDPDLTWETTKEINFGVDLTAFSNRLTFSLDLYNRNTDKIILDVPYPAVISPGNVFVNAGNVRNQGVEAVISWNGRINQNLSYTIGGNYSFNKNELTDVYNPFFFNAVGGWLNNGRYTKEVREGLPLGAFYVHRVTGFDSAGNFTFTPERYYEGTYLPSSIFGFNFEIRYKNFDFSTYFYGVAGNKVYNGLKAQRLQSVNVPWDVLNNFWTPSNPNAINPAPSQDIPQALDYYVEDGSFLRCNNITIGYTLPKFSKFIGSMRVYATALNLFILTGYSGFSPEIIGSPLGKAGIELDAYPTNRSFMFGINANF